MTQTNLRPGQATLSTYSTNWQSGAVVLAPVAVNILIPPNDSIVVLPDVVLPTRLSGSQPVADSARSQAAARLRRCHDALANAPSLGGKTREWLASPDTGLRPIIRTLVRDSLRGGGEGSSFRASDSLTLAVLQAVNVPTSLFVRGTAADCPDYVVRIVVRRTTDLAGWTVSVEKSCSFSGSGFGQGGTWEVRKEFGVWRIVRKLSGYIT